MTELQREFVYLACPYSDDDDAVQYRRFLVATAAAARLMSLGHLVFSPITHGRPMALHGGLPSGWKFWQRLDRVYIRHSHTMFVLPLEGWRRSSGIEAEIEYAARIGVPVVFINPVTFEPEWDMDIDSDYSWRWCEKCETHHRWDHECFSNRLEPPSTIDGIVDRHGYPRTFELKANVVVGEFVVLRYRCSSPAQRDDEEIEIKTLVDPSPALIGTVLQKALNDEELGIAGVQYSTQRAK